MDFIWCDAQGNEANILRGAQDMIRRVRYWYCECDPRPCYKGMATLQEIRSLLPGFLFHGEYAGYNYCFRNEALK